MKILIYGSFGEGNVGDEVILDQLLESFKKDEVTIISKNPHYTMSNFKVNAIREHHTFSIMRILKNILKFRISLVIDRLRVLFSLLACDLFILGGGGIIVEVHKNELTKYLTICRLAKLFGKRVAVNLVGVGPLPTESGKKQVFETFKNIDFISVRDEHSRKLLIECGIESDQILCKPDGAFGYLIPKAKNEKVILINCYERKVNGVRDEVFEKELIRLITYLKMQLGFKIKMIPFGVESDRVYNKHLVENLKFDVEMLDNDSSYKDITNFMGDGYFSISTRFHAGLLSLTNSIPSICLDQQYKSERLLKEMELEKELLISIPDGIHKHGESEFNFENTKKKVQHLLENYDEILEKVDNFSKKNRELYLNYRVNHFEKFINKK